jgi:hypothetical protein
MYVPFCKIKIKCLYLTNRIANDKMYFGMLFVLLY